MYYNLCKISAALGSAQRNVLRLKDTPLSVSDTLELLQGMYDCLQNANRLVTDCKTIDRERSRDLQGVEASEEN